MDRTLSWMGRPAPLKSGNSNEAFGCVSKWSSTSLSNQVLVCEGTAHETVDVAVEELQPARARQRPIKDQTRERRGMFYARTGIQIRPIRSTVSRREEDFTIHRAGPGIQPLSRPAVQTDLASVQKPETIDAMLDHRDSALGTASLFPFLQLLVGMSPPAPLIGVDN